MQKPNFIIITPSIRLKRMVGAFCIAIIALSSCVQEAEIEIRNQEEAARFDSELTSVLDLMQSNSSLAISKLDELIVDAEAINSKYYAGKAKWYKGYIYDEIDQDISAAYHFYKEALKDVLETDDTALKMKIYNNLGVLYRFYGQYDGAISAYKSALVLEGDLDQEQLSDLYYNLGVALKLKGDDISFADAEEAFVQSLEYAKAANYHGNIASVYNQIGLMYKAIENYEMARIAYNNTIETYVGDKAMLEYVGKAYHGIGVTYMDENKSEASIRAFEKALEYKRSSGSIFITKYDLGTVLLADGQQDRAIEIWKGALEEKHNKNSREQVKIYADLTSVLKVKNEYEEALSYSEIYNSSIQNILKEGEKYKNKSDQVLFANVVSEYDAFNKTVPFFSRPLVVLFSLLTAIAMIYLIAYRYHRSRSKRKITEVVSKIQTEFSDIKVD